VKLGVEDGSKLRVDTTVVETDMRRIAGFRNRSRAAHRRMHEIQRMTPPRRQ
jgi:transposase, IS5 family